MPAQIIRFPKKNKQIEDEYRVRMRVNLAALAFISFFLLASCWIIDVLISIPERPDCNFSVRRPCRVNFDSRNEAPALAEL